MTQDLTLSSNGMIDPFVQLMAVSTFVSSRVSSNANKRTDDVGESLGRALFVLPAGGGSPVSELRCDSFKAKGLSGVGGGSSFFFATVSMMLLIESLF